MITRDTLLRIGAAGAFVLTAAFAYATIDTEQAENTLPETVEMAENSSLAEADKKQAEKTEASEFFYKNLKAKGSLETERVNVDADFSKKHKAEIKAPFSIEVPVSDDLVQLAQYPPEMKGSYLKITFGTGDKKFLENIQFTSLVMEVGALEERQKKAAAVLKFKGWDQVTEDFSTRKIDKIRAVKVGKEDGVELIGRYIDESEGVVIVRLLTIFKEGKTDGILAVAKISADFAPITDLDQLDETISGDILKSFQFLETEKD